LQGDRKWSPGHDYNFQKESTLHLVLPWGGGIQTFVKTLMGRTRPVAPNLRRQPAVHGRTLYDYILGWTMLAQGTPIMYYSTEKFFNTTHPAAWNIGYPTDTPGYTFLRSLNDDRKQLDLHTAPMTVEAADEHHLICSRDSAAYASEDLTGDMDVVM
jgi:hypothetical protein